MVSGCCVVAGVGYKAIHFVKGDLALPMPKGRGFTLELVKPSALAVGSVNKILKEKGTW